jgi:hypothetical protein
MAHGLELNGPSGLRRGRLAASLPAANGRHRNKMFVQMNHHAWTERAIDQAPAGPGGSAGALGAWRNASGARVSTPSARRNLKQRELKHKIEILPG